MGEYNFLQFHEGQLETGTQHGGGHVSQQPIGKEQHNLETNKNTYVVYECFLVNSLLSGDVLSCASVVEYDRRHGTVYVTTKLSPPELLLVSITITMSAVVIN